MSIQIHSIDYVDKVLRAFPAICRHRTPEAQVIYDYLAITDVPHIDEDTLRQKIDIFLEVEGKMLADFYPENQSEVV